MVCRSRLVRIATSVRVVTSLTLLTLGFVSVGTVGCVTEEYFGPNRTDRQLKKAGDAAEVGSVMRAGRTEVDLVNELTLHRSGYAHSLKALAMFYSGHGMTHKAAWARNELRGLATVRQGDYLGDGTSKTPVMANVPLDDASDLQLADRNEQDLVEEMASHRKMYKDTLRVLLAYYFENGMDKKATLARVESKGLDAVKQYMYIMDAELPRENLQPIESIAEADQLYTEAMKLLDDGGHHVLFYFSRSTMNKAMNKFKELINKYPMSDKIDDAAYYIAEIYKEYGEEMDNRLAVEWYKRAIQWNPQLPHPAWSHCAHVLDYRLHERELALEWYQRVIDEEKGKGPRFWDNVGFAQRRIKELTNEKTRHAPGETTAGVAAPTISPAEEPAAEEVKESQATPPASDANKSSPAAAPMVP